MLSCRVSTLVGMLVVEEEEGLLAGGVGMVAAVELDLEDVL